MNKNYAFPLIVGLAVALFTVGCFGGKGGDSGPALPGPTVELAGSLSVPTTMNSDLLAKIEVPYSESVVRQKWASATVLVNGAVISIVSITPTSITPTWDIRLKSVPQTSNGLYKIEVNVGKLGLKSWIKESKKDSFTIDSRSTAAALLSQKLTELGVDKDTETLLATFPVFVSDIAKQIENAFATTEAGSVTTSIFSLTSVTGEVASQASLLKDVAGFNPTALVADLKLQNDLDGDGETDLQIVRNTDGSAVRFYTSLSASTTLFDGMTAIGDYTDPTMLADFAKDNTSQKRFFNADSKNFALGLFFKRSAAADIYLKLFVRKIDLVDGSFKGVISEYKYVTATSTALASGTKIFTLASETPALGTVAGSDFLTDGIGTATTLCFVDAARGLGSRDGSARLVRLMDGKPALADVSAAEKYLQGGINYFPNTTAALTNVFKDRAMEVGDSYSAYFPITKHYALFKIKAIATNTVTVDYRVNSVSGETRF